MQNDFTIQLLTLLQKKKLNQKRLAALIGAKEPLVSRWINGKSKPTTKSMVAICSALGLPPDYFEDDNSMNINNSNIGNNNTINNSNNQRFELLEEKIKRLELEIELLKSKIK